MWSWNPRILIEINSQEKEKESRFRQIIGFGYGKFCLFLLWLVLKSFYVSVWLKWVLMNDDVF